MAVFSSFVAAKLAAVLGNIGLSATVATAAANAVIGAGMIVASQALMRSRMGGGSGRGDVQAVINQPAADRTRGYGRMKLGGVRAFFDAQDGNLDQVILLSHGEIDSFEAFFFGDTQVTLRDDGWVDTNPWGKDGATLVRILTRRGLQDSAAYAPMVETWPDDWSDAHKLNGIATLFVRTEAVKLEKFNRIYPESHNTAVRAVCTLSRTYDSRTGRTEWSPNGALHALDFLTHEDGFRLTRDDVSLRSFGLQANVCDQRVLRKNGTAENRYRHSGIYSLAADPKDTLAAILATFDGEVYENTEGKIAIRGGVWEEPTITIYPEHILSFEMEQGNDRFSAFNELTASYLDPSRDYQQNDTPRWIDYRDQAIRGRLPEKIDLSGCPSASQAMRLMKIARFKEQPRWNGRLTTNLAGLEARDEANIRLVIPELGIDGPFRVLSHGINVGAMTCEIEVSASDPAAYEWDPETEEGETSPPLPDRPIRSLPIPEGLTLSVSRRQITPTVTAPVIVATVDEPTRQDLTLDAEYRLAPDSAWEGMTSTELRAVSGPVSDGEEYDVRARWRSARGGAGDWSAIESITITD